MRPLAEALELRQGASTRAGRAVAALSSPFIVLSLAATAASVGVVVMVTGGVLTNPDGFAALVVWTTVGTVAGGLYMQTWRPGNILGGLLILNGFLVALHSLQGSPNPVLFATGLLVEAPSTLILFFVLLAYPSGVLSRTGRIAFAAAAAFFAFAFVPRLFVTEPVWGGSPLATCRPHCPDNPLLLVHNQTVVDVMHYWLPLSRLVAVGAVAVALVLELTRASQPRKRTLMPVAVLGILWILPLAIFGSVQTFTAAGSDLTAKIGFGVVMARAMVPAAFLLAPVQARAVAGLALQQMLARLEGAGTLLARERVIARALDDPRLRLAFWLPQSRQYVDAAGVPAERPDPSSGLVWTPVQRSGQPFAAIIHDAALTEDPELLQAAVRALLSAVSSRRIEADLERSLDELQRSRRVLLDADAADRRRLERDLHTTAQQHLVALRVSLELARGRAEENTALAERLTALGDGLDQALEDLRRIASDIYSPLLEQAGLTAALREAARRSPRPLRLDLQDVGRLPAEIENCIWSCVREALTNSLTHGGEVTPRLRLSRDAESVSFSVGDDGVGFDVETAPRDRGLQGIVERLAAVGGTASIVSAPGRGTVISGSVPLRRVR